MKRTIAIIMLLIMLSTSVFILSGCTLAIETTDNTVSASVDGDTTERVDSIIDWIKERIDRVFDTSDTTTEETTETTNAE